MAATAHLPHHRIAVVATPVVVAAVGPDMVRTLSGLPDGPVPHPMAAPVRLAAHLCLLIRLRRRSAQRPVSFLAVPGMPVKHRPLSNGGTQA